MTCMVELDNPACLWQIQYACSQYNVVAYLEVQKDSTLVTNLLSLFIAIDNEKKFVIWIFDVMW